jgi:hypothetical protein
MATTQPDQKTLQDAQNLLLKRIASLVSDYPAQVKEILTKYKVSFPSNATNAQLGEAISNGFTNVDFMGELYSTAEKYATGVQLNAKGGGKMSMGGGSNPISAIAEAVGNVAQASAQITASVMERDTAKVNQKTKLIDFIQSKDKNKTDRQIAGMQSQVEAKKSGAKTMEYVAIGAGVFLVVALVGIVFLRSRSNSQPS